MKCVKCNNYIHQNASFCGNCGAKVEKKENVLNTYVLRCPNCDGELLIEDGLDTFYCKYCGYKVMLEGISSAAYCAKTKIKGMEHDERMEDKRIAYEKYKFEQNAKREKAESIIAAILVIVLLIGVFVVMDVVFDGEKRKSDLQEEALQELVAEIQEDIDAGEFDDAYVKAKSIIYTENWSDEIEEKWNEIRREMINQIIEAEKEATGKSSHKPEKKGFFEGWFD